MVLAINAALSDNETGAGVLLLASAAAFGLSGDFAKARVKECIMSWQERITLDPDILVGKPVIKGTRLAVEFTVELLAQGWSVNEVLRNILA